MALECACAPVLGYLSCLIASPPPPLRLPFRISQSRIGIGTNPTMMELPPSSPLNRLSLLQSQGRGVSLLAYPLIPYLQTLGQQSSAVSAHIRSKSPFVVVIRSCLCDSDASNATKRIILLAIASYLVQHIINLSLVLFPSSLTSRHIHYTLAILPLRALRALVVTPFFYLVNKYSLSNRAVDSFPSCSSLSILP